jgi:UDP-2,3-diacylglucosamine pyrophosphatase LpxH
MKPAYWLLGSGSRGFDRLRFVDVGYRSLLARTRSAFIQRPIEASPVAAFRLSPLARSCRTGRLFRPACWIVTCLKPESSSLPRMTKHWDELAPDFAFCRHVRALFISDVHLGTRSARAGDLLDFLKHFEADSIYLVGDIVDFWKVRRGPHWPQPHNDVVQKLLRQARKGVRLVLVPGNHDEALRDYAGLRFGGVEVHKDIVHATAKGCRYLVMHGDEFDVVVRSARWLAFLGDRGYEFALWLNNPLNWLRRHFGLGYWSLAAYLKYRVKRAVAYIGAFEEAVATEATRRGVEGVICGHIHHASDRHFAGIHYLNCGDWVESCTAVVETHEGELRVVHWKDTPQLEFVGVEQDTAQVTRALRIVG